MKTFVNFTNHPSQFWSERQTNAARTYGPIVDVPFPAVDPDADEKEISHLADMCVKEILSQMPAAVLAAGEFTLNYAVVARLQAMGIPVLCTCSTRNAEEENGTKISVFEFVRFRAYEPLAALASVIACGKEKEEKEGMESVE